MSQGALLGVFKALGKTNLQGMPSRTFVTHRTTRSIHPRTRPRSSSDSRPASPRPIVPIANAWFRRNAPGLGGRIAPPWHVTGHSGLRDIESEFQQLAMDPRRAP
jgi:hypothetical protein